MIEALFMQILNMSITAGFVICAVLLFRFLLHGQPKIYSYMLWSVVLFRLLCPWSVSLNISAFCMLQSAETANGQIIYDLPQKNDIIVSEQFDVNSLPETNKIIVEDNTPDMIELAASIWIIGVVYIALCNILASLELRKHLKNSELIYENIYHNRHISSAFVTGFFKAGIYLPCGLSEQQEKYILMHEQTHIRRKDNVFKFLAFCALCLHWFNPLVWVAFRLAEKDMEMSCDEAVIKQMNHREKIEYSQTLLNLSSPCYTKVQPAFGESDTKGRIMNILNYKKPTLKYAILIVLALSTVITACAVNPVSETENNVQTSENRSTAPQVSENRPAELEELIFFIKPDETEQVMADTAARLFIDYYSGNASLDSAYCYYSDRDGSYCVDVTYTEYSDDGKKLDTYFTVLEVQENENGNFAITGYTEPDLKGSTDTAIYETLPAEEEPPVKSGSKLIWPAAAGRISRGFTGQYPENHNGIDISAPSGTDIFAAEDGTVIKAEYTSVGEGIYTIIDHGSYHTLYSHCSELYVKEGDKVTQGDVIAAVGCTGNSTGPHLHFAVYDITTELYEDPYNYF